MYLHRYLRYTPSLAVVILFYMILWVWPVLQPDDRELREKLVGGVVACFRLHESIHTRKKINFWKDCNLSHFHFSAMTSAGTSPSTFNFSLSAHFSSTHFGDGVKSSSGCSQSSSFWFNAAFLQRPTNTRSWFIFSRCECFSFLMSFWDQGTTSNS